jgi:hypothetical protein
MTDLRAPFPWFGGKSCCAHLVWERFGDVPNYVEPFFGSGAVLLARPHEARIETVNDLDCMVANFWRALQHDPEAVACAADWPVNEADQHARHLWLCSQEAFRERMKTDPDFFNAKIAGWWVWGQCIYIGSGWCEQKFPESADCQKDEGDAGRGVHRKLPHLGDAGTGVHRQLPHLGDAGTGVHRQLPHLGDAGTGVLIEYMQGLAQRLRRVRVACGDWSRVVTPSVTDKHGVTGVFLDPPYTEGNFDYAAGGCGGDVARAVFEWAIENGDNPLLRIALCGYDGEHKIPSGWEEVQWKARKGYQADEAAKDRKRERIWFSPACLRPSESLFSAFSDPYSLISDPLGPTAP